MHQNEIRKQLELELERLVEEAQLVKRLKDGVCHMLFPGGKRIRPLLSLTFASDLNAAVDKLLPAACALEFLHTSSLIHDDLPAMDNDDFRRGKPSCHKAFGEASAILAGDVLVALAFRAITSSSIDPAKRDILSAALAKTYIGLCNGQELDMQPAEQHGDVKRIYEFKTGALFGACMSFAAIVADRGSAFSERSYLLGSKIGLAFQIVDDLIDSDKTTKGRPNSSDKKNDKATFIATHSKEQLKELLEELKIEITAELQNLSLKANSDTLHLISSIFQAAQ